MKSLLIITILLSALIAGDLNGKWTGKIKIPNGDEIDISYNFKVDSQRLTGSVQTPWGEYPITNGKVNGDLYTFSQDVNNTTYTHTGRVSGDSLYVKIAGAETPLESVFLRSNN